MDRFFLEILIREIEPHLRGERVRTVRPWEGGFCLVFSTRPPRQLTVSLQVEAPGLYLGPPPGPLSVELDVVRLKKLLSGAVLTAVEVAPLDRLLSLRWKRSRPSGAQHDLSLHLHWLGTRSAAVVVDESDGSVLDVISRGVSRYVPGEAYAPPPLPPGAAPLPRDRCELEERLAEARQTRGTNREAARRASGLSPILAEELLRLSEAGAPPGEAFDRIRRRVQEEPTPTLLRRDEGAGERTMRATRRLSPIRLEGRPGWSQTSFASFNEAAHAFILEGIEQAVIARLRNDVQSGLRKRFKRARSLADKLERETPPGDQAATWRRYGELLLAGLRDARRGEHWVEVTDHYDPDQSTLRIPIDRRHDLVDNAQRFFRKARKAERALEAVKERRERVRAELDYLETMELSLAGATTREELEMLRDELAPAKKKERQPTPSRGAREGGLEPRRFASSSGGTILVGRSGRSNDTLTFRLAKPEDLWFHAAGVPGAHVVLRRKERGEARPSEIEEAAAVAAHFSKARDATSAEVIVAERKHVRRIPGAPPGTVRVGQCTTVRVRPALPPHNVNAKEASIEGGEGSR